jgi:hypothetical protein
MPNVLKRTRWAAAVLAFLLAALLACELNPLSVKPMTAVPTQAEPPSTVVATSEVQIPTTVGTAPATVVPTEPTIVEPTVAGPAKDPCGLPGIQFRANFATAAGTNALTAPFSGDVTKLETAGGPNIFSIQEASVQRKFVILLKNLDPGAYDLKSTYMSYTEKTGANDKNPRIWKAANGFLQVGRCYDNEGLLDPHAIVLWTFTIALSHGDPVLFQPLPGGHNTATGDMLIEVGAKFQ